MTATENVVDKPANGGGTEHPSVWTFLTNHSHVLICLAGEPTARLRDLADWVGITERAVQRIITDLEDAGFVTRIKYGRRNCYEIHPDQALRHSIESHCTVRDLIGFVRDR